ncbi:PQQ-like beta-propeller repeat protein [Brachybacterium muris]|uniref:PQQ-like beta-propeller repeat protein n=1 Tax=Brachybacterium muris TaxID=219301 RepID=UPI00223C3EFF|nr:PQQ-like beta-propeller repeat protein [Brachybacterium muris]MCT2260354.1 PQQ-like beta-propeller repeat protein [Brachybacterium muris]
MTATPSSSARRSARLEPTALPRLLLALAVLLMGTVGIAQVAPPTAPASAAPIVSGTETEIGSAFEDKVPSPQAAHGVGTDGRSLTYFVTSGNGALPALFQAIDTLTGAVVFEQRIPAGIDAWGITVSGSTVVFTVNDSAAHLYTWAPGQQAVHDLGAPFGSDSVWSLTTAPDGTVFAGTYPTGRVLSVNARTGAVRALGTPNPGEAYVRALAADDRYVYAGSLGTGKLARIDRSTGAMSAITLPTALSGTNNTISDLALRGKYLVVTSSSATAMYLYDTTTGSFAKSTQIDGAGNALPASTTISGVNSAVSPVRRHVPGADEPGRGVHHLGGDRDPLRDRGSVLAGHGDRGRSHGDRADLQLGHVVRPWDGGPERDAVDLDDLDAGGAVQPDGDHHPVLRESRREPGAALPRRRIDHRRRDGELLRHGHARR